MQDGRIIGQRATTADFVARPRLLNRPGAMAGGQGMFRDTYREFMKVVPQNIMHDRRVVRGNTFAALVIPVSKLSYLWKSFQTCSRMCERRVSNRIGDLANQSRPMEKM
jgi:hypothetical protein